MAMTGGSKRWLSLFMTGFGIMLVAVALAATGDSPLSAAPNTSPSHVIVDSGSVTVNNASLPVTGSVTVSGTVGLGAGTQIGVSNTAANPIPVSNLDEPGRHAFQISIPWSTWYSSWLSGATPWVPLPGGKAAVIEQISYRVFVPQGQRPIGSIEQQTSEYPRKLTYIPLTFQGSGWGTTDNPWDAYVGTLTTKIFVDAGGSVRFRADRPIPPTGDGEIDDAFISGYTIDP